MFQLDNARTLFQVVEQVINIAAPDSPERENAKAGHRTAVATGADAKEIVKQLRHTVHQCKEIGFGDTHKGDVFFYGKGGGELVLLGKYMWGGKGARGLDDFDADNAA